MPRRLFVYLHGHGSSPAEVDDVVSAVDPDRDYIAVTPEGPLAISVSGRAWFDSDARGVDDESLDRAIEWVRGVLVGCTADLGVDMSDVVLGGFSQGASTALAVAASLDVALGGLLLQAPFAPDGPQVAVALRSTPATRVLVQFGESDDVVPSFLVDHVAAELAASGCTVETQPFATGHDRSPEMLEAARRWMQGRLG